MRVADVTKPVEIELPGIAHRFAKGHRFRARGDHQPTRRTRATPSPARCRSPPTPPTPAPSRCRGSELSVSTLPGRCLSRRSPIGPRNIGRIRLGYTRAQILRRVRVQPERRTARTYRYCVTGRTGVVTAVFSSRSRRARVRLVTTTARGHGNRRVRVGSRSATFARAYSRRRRVARGIFRASPRSPRLFGVRRGKVSFIAVTRSTRGLRRQLRLAGVRPR